MPKATSKKKKGVAAEVAIPASERTINGFICENAEKFQRAIEGTVGAEGRLVGGVGESASPEAKLAEYDRLGGLVTKDGRKVKTGCFFDFDAQAPNPEPEPVLEFRIDDEIVEVPVGAEIPVEVKAAEFSAAKKSLKAQAKATKAPKGKAAAKPKPSIEDEEE